MKKSILWIGYNFNPEPTGIGKYSGEQLAWLAKSGYTCTVISAYPYYPYWKVQEPYRARRFWYTTEVEHFASGGSLTICRCPMYIPATPSGIKRILLDLSFLITAFFRLLLLFPTKKYDIVVTVIPSVTLGLLGMLYKKVKRARFICHVHDMQVEAARDLGLIRFPKAIHALFKLERYVFDYCDVITCVGEGMSFKIKAKTRREIDIFLNTTDLAFFYPLTDKAELKTDYGFAATDKIALYSGAIGEKQGIEAVIYAAKEFTDLKRLKFIICGSGPYKSKLQDLADSLNLKNVYFFPLQPLETFNRFLNMADVHLIIQKANASDLVMPSKLNTVLAIGGVALVTANQGSGIFNLLEKHSMGLLVEAENPKALQEGILKALTEDTELLSQNARHYAENNLGVEAIMQKFEVLINNNAKSAVYN